MANSKLLKNQINVINEVATVFRTDVIRTADYLANVRYHSYLNDEGLECQTLSDFLDTQTYMTLL